MKHQFKTISTFTDLTSVVVQYAAQWQSGMIHVHSLHTTLGIKIMESEILAFVDMNDFLERIAPRDHKYYHNDCGLRNLPPEERRNGHAHVRSLFFPTSELIPLHEGKLQLGQWQAIIAVELDGPRDRTILLTHLPLVAS